MVVSIMLSIVIALYPMVAYTAQMTKQLSTVNVKHGHKRAGRVSPTYRVWLGMKRRCQDAKYKDFPKYGGAGISVCRRWNESFMAFLDDMGERPSRDHSIDRIDSYGDYEPGNCRWATSFQQGAEHRRSLRPVRIGDIDYPSLAAACRAYGVSKTTLNMRLKGGIELVEAITTPVGQLPNRRPRESYLRKDRP
jgi:hypothetical protein